MARYSRPLRKLADSIVRTTPSAAAVGFRLGTIEAYTPGDTFASVAIGADTVDSPFDSHYTPTVGDVVAVLLVGGQSPYIIGAPAT